MEDEAQLFCSSGYFNSELGDTVLLTLSNVLGVSIIVFTSISGNSVINIIPQYSRIPVSIHLAYLQYGSGHYDIALPPTIGGCSQGRAALVHANVKIIAVIQKEKKIW